MSRRSRAWWASWIQDVPASQRSIGAALWPPPAAATAPIDLDPNDVIGLWSSDDATDAPVTRWGVLSVPAPLASHRFQSDQLGS